MPGEKVSTHPDSTGIECAKSVLVMDMSNEEKSTGEGNTSEIFVDPTIEKKVLRRLDKRFAPLFCALYFFGEPAKPCRRRSSERTAY